MKMKTILLCAAALGGVCAFGGEVKESAKSTATANTQCPDGNRPRRPNGLADVDRKNLPKLWSAPGVKEHVLKRMDGGDDLVFVECPPGDFTMGFREGNGSAFSKHRVTLTYPFWMLKTQLTWGQFYMPGVSERAKGSRGGCNSFSCEQMAAYLHCMNDKYASQIPKGYVIRFPTFAEYQYAYRANSKDPSDPYTHDAFVGDERKRICHDNETRKGWNGNRRTWPRVWPAEVGLLEPNAWGLYDMCGNGFTYLCDRVNPDLSDANRFSFLEQETDPIIYEEDAGRMLMRGGDSPDWLYKDFFCTWRWAFTCRLVVGPDLEKKGREQMERTSQARHDAAFTAMTDGLAKRKHGPTELLGRKTVRLFPGCEMEFVQCPPGSFTMGHEVGNGPFRRREVTISRPFYIATERLTFGVWFKYLEATGRVVPEEQRAVARKRGGERCALCGLKDEDWNGFLAWLNDRCASEFNGSVFRLPTETEWEYAYRAGANRQDDPFAWTVPFLGRQAGAAAPFAYTEDERRQDFIRFGQGSVTETSWDAYTADWRRKMLVAPGQVGTKKANAWGLKDMIGNGREWVLDRFCCAIGKFPSETYGQLPSEADPLFGYELDKWDCQMCRGGDDGYAGRKCWDANGSGWGEDTWYPKELFCYRLVIGPDLISEKRVKTAANAEAVSATTQELQPRRTLGSRLARPAACAVQGQGSCGAESATEKTRKAVAELFPGWSLDTEVANHDWAGIQACYRGQTNVVFIHPVNRETPAIVSRTVMLSDKNPCLHLKVASHSEDHDFGLSVRVDGKDALPMRRICTQDFAPWEDVFVPLSKWRGGMAKIEIVLTGINRWTCEFPYFACIEICEGTGDTRIDGKATVDGYTWSYRVNNGEAMIVAETDGRMTCAVSPSPIGHVTIPETLDGVKVTGIGYNAFCDCSGITSVTIPSTVKIIGRGAFARCRGLTSLTIPDGVVDIGRESFLGCTGLASMTIPDSVKGIWRNAFRGCAGLTSLAIPSGVTNIEGEAFRGCCALMEVTISSTVTNIDGTAFCDCSALTAVHVDDGNWFHDGNQFYKSENGLLLTKDGTTLVRGVMGDVTVPSSVTNIGGCAFEGCCALRSVRIPSSVKVIGPYAFKNCKGLASVMIPEGVASIGHEAFNGCSGLKSVTLPKGVEIICNSAFMGTALTSVEIPLGVKTLERAAFAWCGGLKAVKIPESVTNIGRDVFYNCGALESVNIPTGVTSIGLGAFNSCNGLSSVEIPETVTKIDKLAFWNCRGLKSVTMRGSCPASPNNVFEGCGNLKTIHVPANSKSWAGLKEWQGKTLAFDGPKMSDEQLAKESEQQAKSEQMQNKDRPRTLGGVLRARRLQRQQEAQAAAEKQQTELTAQEKAQREVEREEQRQQLLAIQEELKRVRAAKAAAAVDNIKGAVTTWMLDNKKSTPPSTLSVLVKADGDKKPQLDGGEKALVDPWGQSYMIQIKGKWFAIVSAGPDTKFHTADDIRTDNGGDKEQGSGRLVRTSEAKAPAVKNQGLAASTNCVTKKSVPEKISVAEKLGQCDFLLNKDFKKDAKFYLCLFSASWCPPCRREMPRIAKTYAETLKNDPDIELIHFSRDQNDEKALAWAKEHNVKFPVVRPKGGNPLDLHSRGIPHLFIVKADGTLVEEGHPMRIFNEEKFGEIKGAVGQAKPQSVKADVATQNDRKSDGVQLWENGPYWAECNVGALKPEESGYHFWWGDTVGYRRDGRNWVSSKGTRMTASPFEKSSCLTWDKSNSELLTLGYTDSAGNLVPSHDAATVHLGAPWRMPTEAELVALVRNCDSEWAICNGVEGRLVKGRGAYASKSIFLPAGSYWPSSPESDSPIGAKLLSVSTRDFGRNNYGRGLNFSCGRMNSHSIRPVRGCAKSDDHVTGSSDKGVVTFTDGKYTWTAVRKDGGLCLMAASPELSGDVILPMVGNGIEVKGVGELAFRSKSKLKTLQIPGRIQIGQGAFRQCENLESVTMKGGTAGWSAFSGCEKLGDVFVGKDVSGLWYRSFADCTSLTNVIFEDGAKPLSLQAPFKGDVKLERLHLPARFRFEASWHNGAFSSCDALTNLTIDARNRYCKVENGIVMSLDGKKVYAFATGFSSFTFPATVEEITYRATEGCNKVREFLFPDSLRTLDSQSIYECKALESVTMGAGVKRIGGSLFYQCDNLQSITMRGEKPDSAENIFSNGKSLKSIHVSANAKSWAGMKEWQGIPLVFDAETK